MLTTKHRSEEEPRRFSSCDQTFGQRGHQERDADHSHQILNGNERAQDGPDTDGLSLPRVDQLTEEDTSHQEGHVIDMKPYVHVTVKGEHSHTHVHLWSAAAQQIDQSRVEGHDGVSHVNGVVLLFLHDVITMRHTDRHQHVFG